MYMTCTCRINDMYMSCTCRVRDMYMTCTCHVHVVYMTCICASVRLTKRVLVLVNYSLVNYNV